MRKRYYVSERITNISNLEKILEKERLCIAVLKAELKKNTPPNELNSALEQLEEMNKKAINFEFCLERRKTHN